MSKAKFNGHAGHNPSGKIACGATGLLDESKENRLIFNKKVGYKKIAKTLADAVVSQY